MVHTYMSSIHTLSPVYTYSPVPAPHHTLIFTHDSSDRKRQSDDLPSSPASVTPKGNPTPCNNSPSPVPNVPSDPDSSTSSSDYSLLDLSDSSESGCTKLVRHTRKNKEPKLREFTTKGEILCSDSEP